MKVRTRIALLRNASRIDRVTAHWELTDDAFEEATPACTPR